MDVRFVALDLTRIDALRYEALALPFFFDERPLRGAPGLCDWRLCGRLSRLILDGHVTGALHEVTLVPARPRLPFDKLLLVGCGLRAEFDRERFGEIIAQIFDVAEGLLLRNLALSLPGRSLAPESPSDVMRWFVESAASRGNLEEALVLDELEAHKAMQPIVDAERRRARANREVVEEAQGAATRDAGSTT